MTRNENRSRYQTFDVQIELGFLSTVVVSIVRMASGGLRGAQGPSATTRREHINAKKTELQFASGLSKQTKKSKKQNS